MRCYLSCLGLLLGLLACGIKGPPRPPKAQVETPPAPMEAGAFEEEGAEEGAESAERAESAESAEGAAGPEGAEPSPAEEKLPFEEELR